MKFESNKILWLMLTFTVQQYFVIAFVAVQSSFFFFSFYCLHSILGMRSLEIEYIRLLFKGYGYDYLLWNAVTQNLESRKLVRSHDLMCLRTAAKIRHCKKGLCSDLHISLPSHEACRWIVTLVVVLHRFLSSM